MISFSNRMFVVILTMVLVVGASAMYASLGALRQDMIENSAEDLQVGKRVLAQLIASQQQELATSVGVLTEDYGFQEAVSIGDEATVGSVLANHGRRVGAQLATFIALDGSIVASSHDFGRVGESNQFPFTHLLVDQATPSTDIVEVGDRAYQLVINSVRVPQHIGWVGMGFEINDSLSDTLKGLTQLEVSFYSDRGIDRVLASTLPSDQRNGLIDSLNRHEMSGSPVEIGVLGTAYLSVATLTGSDRSNVTTILQRSLDDALAGYRALFEKLAIIFGLALLFAIPVARYVAGSVTRPVTLLGRAAQRIEQGEYDEHVSVQRNDELGALANAFNQMQLGIAQREAKIIHHSRHDDLTGLPNRAAISEGIVAALAGDSETNRTGSLILVDILSFKAVNDAFGHRVGDSVIQKLGQFLSSGVESTDMVARYGSNSFVMLLTGAGQTDAETHANRIRALLENPLPIDELNVRIDITAGISVFPIHGKNPEDLLRRAEIAMYGARDRGKSIATYQLGEDESHLRRLDIGNKLASAIDQDELEIHFQPKLNLATGDCRYAEALVRWTHPTLGMVSPGEFVPIAEQSGLIQPLTRLVLRKTIKQIGLWNAAGTRVDVSINVSAIDVSDHEIVELVGDLIKHNRVSAAQLCLEITETAVMENAQATLPVLAALKALGVRLSIDDFGTGFSSLTQLKSLPVSELKIDRSFVAELPNKSDDLVIVKSVIELAHNMNLKVVAEGVETAECSRWLAAAGCELAQGYGISRPIPSNEFITWLETFDAMQFMRNGATDDDFEQTLSETA